MWYARQMFEALRRDFAAAAPAVDFCSLRAVRERHEQINARHGVLEPVESLEDVGVMITVVHGGGLGYAATSDTSPSGLREAAERARDLAQATAGRSVVDFGQVPMPSPKGSYVAAGEQRWDDTPLGDRIALVMEQAERLRTDDRIVDSESSLWFIGHETLYLTADGGEVQQQLDMLVPYLSATAAAGSDASVRSLGGRGVCRQGGLETLQGAGWYTEAPVIAGEALALLTAPDCPTGAMDLLIAPDQGILQIHESIGHPLELDRILGDERNYAGTSFVTLEMFGSVPVRLRAAQRQHGSTTSPARWPPSALMTTGLDPSSGRCIIEDGVLKRPHRRAPSERRRAPAWPAPPTPARQRAGTARPMDRMANLNLEPGDTQLRRGDRSRPGGARRATWRPTARWSIDDSPQQVPVRLRDRASVIEDGKRHRRSEASPTTGACRRQFWRNLVAVGRRGHLRDPGHPPLRQGRAQPGHPRGSRGAAPSVSRRGSLRRRMMQRAFFELADHIQAQLRDGEVFTAYLQAEASDFVRFNHGRVRQAGHVQQSSLQLDLIEGQRRARGTVTLTGHDDAAQVSGLLERLRATLSHLPEDPYLLYATDAPSGEHVHDGKLPSAAEAIEAVTAKAADLDLVGIYAAGPVYAGFASSLGQRNWFCAPSFNFDFSLYLQGDKAAKASYAGTHWDAAALHAKIDATAEHLDVLAREPRTIEPGRYRVYLAPAALEEIMSLCSWGGFSLKAQRTRYSCLQKLVDGERSLAPAVNVRENTGGGVSPDFGSAGFVLPAQVPLIDGGKHAGSLVSPRSAKEYDVATNGAAGEMPNSIDMDGGDIPSAEVLERLGTGVWVNNLWYLNFSDRLACRMTGMTRFATFWVENGEVVAPLSVMRFDEGLYRMFGDHLIGFTAEREELLDAGSYGARSTRSSRLPGALVEDFAFTL